MGALYHRCGVLKMIYILNKFESNPYSGIEIDTTSRGRNKDLSPFFLGPVATYVNGVMAQNVENLWQYSKVYPEFVDGVRIKNEYYEWRNKGWASEKAHRYPMGKGKIPLFALWNSERCDYVLSRKRIYIPAYARMVKNTKSMWFIQEQLSQGRDVVLRDFDGYDFMKLGMTLRDVVNDPTRKMGHAFVIAMILNKCLDECLA